MCCQNTCIQHTSIKTIFCFMAAMVKWCAAFKVSKETSRGIFLTRRCRRLRPSTNVSIMCNDAATRGSRSKSLLPVLLAADAWVHTGSESSSEGKCIMINMTYACMAYIQCITLITGSGTTRHCANTIQMAKATHAWTLKRPHIFPPCTAFWGDLSVLYKYRCSRGRTYFLYIQNRAPTTISVMHWAINTSLYRRWHVCSKATVRAMSKLIVAYWHYKAT